MSKQSSLNKSFPALLINILYSCREYFCDRDYTVSIHGNSISLMFNSPVTYADMAFINSLLPIRNMVPHIVDGETCVYIYLCSDSVPF